MSNGMNGASDSTSPKWQERAIELSSAWQSRVRVRIAEAVSQIEPVEVQLPDWEPVLAVQVDVLSLLDAGRVPDTLTPYVLDMLKISRDGGLEASAAAIQKTWDDYIATIDAVWLACVVAPKFVADGPMNGDAIPMRLVPTKVKQAFFTWANGMAEADVLSMFRDNSAGDVARIAPDGEGVRPGPASTAGDQSNEDALDGVAGPKVDFLRRQGSRKPAEADDAGARTDAGAGAEKLLLDGKTDMDIRAGGRDGKPAGERKGRGRSSDRRASATPAT